MSKPKYQTDADAINWDGVEQEVVRKFRYLRHFLKAAPEPLRKKVMEDLIAPNVKLLAEFCANIEESES